MKTKISTILVVLFIITFQAQAYVLTFDDISDFSEDSLPIPDGYGGFNWEDFYYINAPAVVPDSGYDNGLVSGDYVAFASTYENPGTGRILGDLFTFNGAYLTGAWRDGLNVKVDGYLNDVLLYSTTVVVDTTGPTWFDFDYVDIDALDFSAYGGTQNPNYPFQEGTHFAIDNFTYIPEPTTFLLFGLGCIFLRTKFKGVK